MFRCPLCSFSVERMFYLKKHIYEAHNPKENNRKPKSAAPSDVVPLGQGKNSTQTTTASPTWGIHHTKEKSAHQRREPPRNRAELKEKCEAVIEKIQHDKETRQKAAREKLTKAKRSKFTRHLSSSDIQILHAIMVQVLNRISPVSKCRCFWRTPSNTA